MMMAIVRTVWVLPTTGVGLLVGVACLPTGARWRRHSGVIEIHGGGVSWLLEHATVLKGGAMAMTLGEVVLGVSEAALEVTRSHERVHVRQARRWGPLFIPAYVWASVVAMARGRHFYRGNAFEMEAYDEGGRDG
ncbi:MAG TPA: hypothetical protein VH253_19425 [Phycisphaerae bacterium]|nr:hypothetical protein [Phycisphaerae bacterium]